MFAVFDTNHFRELAKGTALGDRINQRTVETGVDLFTTIITVQEATEGWLALVKRERPGRDQVPAYRQFQHTLAAFQKYVVLPFDADAAGVFHRLQGERIRVGTMDLKIAAICIAHQATLLTRNLVDFEKVPRLRVENGLD